MSLSDVSIRRPVLTLMMTLSLVVFGVLGFMRLGVDQFPSMEFPVVMVTAFMDGATPEVIEEDVTDVLEEQLNTIAGVRSLESRSIPGSSMIQVQFELGRNLEDAAQDVRDRVGQARQLLPPEVEPPLVQKFNMNSFPIVWLPLTSPLSPVENTEYLKRQIKPRIETVPGVAATQLLGELERTIRIWLDVDALSSRGLAATDVLSAIKREHVDIPGGTVEGANVQYAVKTQAEFTSIEDLEGLVVAHDGNAPIYLRDVARVEDGADDEEMIVHYNRQPTVAIGVIKQPGANAVQIADEAFRRIDLLRPSMPEGMQFGETGHVIDFTLAIREAVHETLFALAFGAVLAVLTVFVFLRRTRPTLIVAAAIPLSIIATFGVMWVAGFTLNVMSLMGLTLAVGVVIDDAIVVLENIERHREAGESPYEAASIGTREIAFAATAATFSIAAVFLPVMFAEGVVGSFLGEFGITVACAVIVSLFVALTLTPMLAARMPPPQERSHGSIYHRLERGFTWIETRYRGLLNWAIDHRAATLGLAALALFAAIGFGSQLGREFFPPEDQGNFMVQFETAPGTTLQATAGLMAENEAWVDAQPEVKGIFAAAGMGSGMEPPTSNRGVMFATLSSRHERKRTAQELIREARLALGRIPGQKLNVFDMSGSSNMSGRLADFEFNVQGNLDLVQLDALADELTAALVSTGGFVDMDKSLKLGLPEVRVLPDRAKAAELGIDATSLASVIQAMIGGLDIGTFKEGGRGYDIRVRLEKEDRAEPEAIRRLSVRASDGSLHELRNLVRIEKGAAPSAITRNDRQRSVAIFGNLEGIELATAMERVQAIAPSILPEGVRLVFGGQAEQMAESGRQFLQLMILAILVIYMVLASQFESLVHPLTVMLALPLAMTGALGGLLLCGMTLNLFSMIGIILLFGLVTKNSILLVDYANQLRAEGMDKVEAMRTAAPIRMRPVLMTAISMIFGVLPAALALGPGAESRQPMGVATAAGMLSSTLLTLIVVPVFYLVLEDSVEWVKALPRRLRGRGKKPATV